MQDLTKLERVAKALGALTVSTITGRVNEPVTHIVHKALIDIIPKEVRSAHTRGKCYVVSPEWLLQCMKQNRRVSEAEYRILETDDSIENKAVNETTNNKTAIEQNIQVTEHSDHTLEVQRKPFEIDDSDAEDEELSNQDNLDTTVFEGAMSKDEHSRSESGTEEQHEAQEEDVQDQTEVTKTTRITRATLKIGVDDGVPIPVSDLLNMGTHDEVVSILEKQQPRRLRGKLQGRATSNAISTLSRENTSHSMGSANASFEDTLSGADIFQTATMGKKRSDEGFLFTQTQKPQSQALTYADPEAQRQRLKMIAKLNGQVDVETPLKSAKKTKGSVVQDIIEPRRHTRGRPSL